MSTDSSASYSSLIPAYAKQQPTSISLKTMYEQGSNATAQTLLEHAKFLYREVPIRLARRAVELRNLPYGLSNQPTVQTVRSWYEESFKDIMSAREPQNAQDELDFTRRLEIILDRHKNVVPMMAKGVMYLKRELGVETIDDCPFLQDFLDRFYMARIGIRMLITQHVELHYPKEGYAGAIDSACSPLRVAELAASDAKRVCERAYANAPEVEILCKEKDLTFRYVTHHLHHILHELVKNSMRAVVEYHGVKNYDLPPIQIIIANGASDVSIKVADQGGGIPRNEMGRIWTYLYTTAKQTPDLEDETTFSSPNHAPMAGFGYGLPLSRLFARYWGGELEVNSMHGYGTDAYVYLNKLGDSKESLPS